MAEQTKKCPMCAEIIPLAAVTCEYCGTQFEVSGTGYCQNCHDVREANEHGQCKICGTSLTDLRLESKFVEEALPQPETQVPLPPPTPTAAPIRPRRSSLPGVLVIVVLVVGAVFGLVWLGSRSPSVTPAARATITQASTRIPSHTPNHEATMQASTRAAATAQFAWVDTFAKPILSDIEGHSPNFEDDFSVMTGRFARWSSLSGKVMFTEGVMRLNTTGRDGASAGGSLIATDFVLEFEFTPRIISDGSAVAPGMRWNDVGGYGFNLNLNDPWCGLLSIPVGQDVRFVVEGSSDTTGLNHKTSVVIIAKDKRFAFYANGKPLFSAEDSTWLGDWVDIGVWAPKGPAEVDFDNVQFWDLNNLKP